MNFRQQCGQHAFEELRVAPKHVESLFEQLEVIMSRDKNGAQRGAKIDPVFDADRLHRCQRIDRTGRTNGQASRSQDAHKVNDVLGEPRIDLRMRD